MTPSLVSGLQNTRDPNWVILNFENCIDSGLMRGHLWMESMKELRRMTHKIWNGECRVILHFYSGRSLWTCVRSSRCCVNADGRDSLLVHVLLWYCVLRANEDGVPMNLNPPYPRTFEPRTERSFLQAIRAQMSPWWTLYFLGVTNDNGGVNIYILYIYKM